MSIASIAAATRRWSGGEAPRRRAAAATVLAASLAGALTAGVGAQGRVLDLLPLPLPVVEVCGTDVERARQLGLRPRAAVPATEPLSFEQSPAILTPDYTGGLTLRRLTIVGDVASIRIKLATSDAETQTFARIATDVVRGRQVSIFEPSWPAATIGALLRWQLWGWDHPSILIGELLTTPEATSGKWISVRVAPTSLPVVAVRRLADDVQYSSSVVNIVLPDFGSRVIDDHHDFDLRAVTQKFYQHFVDEYDSIAVVPQDMYLVAGSAFHRVVRNDVRGIGLGIRDESESYGSRSGRLHGVEVFHRASLTDNSTSAHEMAHQWGAYIDWTRLAGLQRAGHQTEAHDPLWALGETFVGSVLSAERRVKRTETGWQIERTPRVARFHPFTLYAMGLIAPEQVPEVTLFDEQGQFDPDNASEPDPGREVVGATRTATIYNVIGMLGPRSGPVHREIRRATVVVSRQRLLTEQEMDYWTFFAQRLSDPAGSGLPGFVGTGSFDEATYRMVDLRTEIVPLDPGGRIVEPLPVYSAPLGRRDLRDVVFDAPVPTRYRAGQRIELSGVVNAERSDFDGIIIMLRKGTGNPADDIRLEAPVTSAGSFNLAMTLEERHKGVYAMQMFLFWPGAGGQRPRMSISPIVIE